MKPYYEYGGITIYHGDNREVLPHLPPIDLILTDPPYGINADKMTLGNGKRRVYRGEMDWDSEPADVAPLLTLAPNVVIWGGNYFQVPPSRCWLVWDKGTGDNDYADCELAWTNRDGVVKKFFRSWVGANAKERKDYDRYHPTQKPVALMAWCMGFYPDAKVICDPYMGAGSTLRAAKDLGRSAIGIEVEERYCESAAKRLEQEVLAL
jgi:DNA modification methylase